MGCVKSKLYSPHAAQRAYERYGLTVNKTVAREIMGQIRSGKGTLAYKPSCSRRVYFVTVNGETFHVVYSVKQKRIITFLTMPYVPPPTEPTDATVEPERATE